MNTFIPATETIGEELRPKRPRRIILIVVIIVIVAVILISALVIHFVSESANTEDQPAETETVALSEQTVLASLNTIDIPQPDLSNYAYVDTANLIGPRFEDLTIGEAFIDGATQQTYRVITVNVTYRNNSVVVSMPLMERFIYDDDTTTWNPGDISQGAITVAPQKALSTSMIEKNLPELLDSFDSSLADQFEDCSTLLTPSLDETGGSVEAALSKTVGDELLSCTLNLDVSWVDGEGWNITITSASDVYESDIGENIGGADLGADGIVELTGTIEMRDGLALLRTDRDIHITAHRNEAATDEEEGNVDTEDESDDNESDDDESGTSTTDSWSTDLFELIFNDVSLSVSPGETVTIRGAITESEAFEDVPLAIEVTDVQETYD